jgi:CRISPR-associated endonuclease/helicase Cas3
MTGLEESNYRAFFQRMTGYPPFDYQIKTARLLLAGKNIVLRAPTGAGKTWSVLAPFLFPEWRARPVRLIYALPLRTLAEGVYREAREAASRLGLPIESEEDAQGREVVSPFVTLQTGEHPDDRFFDRGRIIVTTYDQVLSGLLDGPYGLSDRLHNINAAAVAGALVVFDEFHLMEPQKAFLTAAAGLHLFRDLCQSVWMTATATQPLEQVLGEALDAVVVPETRGEADALLDSLPSVARVVRRLVVEDEPLSAASVLRWHERRSIVLLNTVGRAQAMYEMLRQELGTKKRELPLILLHSRFFKEDRGAKEARLRALFGKAAKGPAILVATQVVEAGLDLSSDHLHTELCPMNALIQRAGRCARFEGEAGTVHIYSLPATERSWLPYGGLQHEDATLTRTRSLLERVGQGPLHPRQTTAWVQDVHGADDEQALREGWRLRLSKCLALIEQSAICRTPTRVADLIRGEDTDSLRVIIAEDAHRLESPGLREGLNISRRALYRLLQQGEQDIGWYWDGQDQEPWKSIRTPAHFAATYAVCLRPAVAAYDGEVGLRLGLAGTQESPNRREPPRPGYAPLHAETWSDHARRVAEESQKRLDKDHSQGGILGSGFVRRYGLTPDAIHDAVTACAFLHDLGKLQDTWQRWAKAMQRARLPTYRHAVPLAHTDFTRSSEEDRQRERALGIARPAHAPASALYGGAFLAKLLPHVSQERRTEVASACAAAVLAHHGGWLPEALDLGISKLWGGWETSAMAAFGWVPDGGVLRALEVLKDKHGTARQLLQITTGSESLAEWWPLVAFLTRTLRLSDQRATAEGASHE